MAKGATALQASPTYFEVRRYRTEVPDYFRGFPVVCDRDKLIAAQLKGRNRILEVGAGDRPFLTNFSGAYKTMDVDPTQKHDFYSVEEIQEPFDAVLMREVVEHISHGVFFSYLAKFAQILNPGGVLILSTPNPWAGGAVFAYDYTHISPWNMRDMYCVLRCYGFQPVEISRIIWPSRFQWLKKAYWAIHSRLYQLDYAGGYVAIGRIGGVPHGTPGPELIMKGSKVKT
jgi:SAM-dependent methyltransferase